MIKLSASIIGRNEQEMLPEMLETIKGIDEIVFIDTGSEDDTVKIAKKAGAKVYTDYKWNDHFSEARNVAKDRCTGDWLLIIDCDEKLIGGINRLKQFLDNKRMKDYDAVFFDVDTGQEVNQQMRIIRNIGAASARASTSTSRQAPRAASMTLRSRPMRSSCASSGETYFLFFTVRRCSR